MGWWSEPAFSKKKTTNVKGSTNARGRQAASKCSVCGKNGRGCKCHLVGQSVGARPASKGHAGTKKADADRIDDRGVIWCGTCNMRVNPKNGVCMNVKCSTRR